MKKATFLSTVFIFFLSNTFAQQFDLGKSDTPPSFVVLDIDGSAKYKEDGSSEDQDVKSGMTLSGTGTLTLDKKSQMKLLWKSQSVILDKKGTYSLKNEAKKLADASGNASASDDFLIAMGAASGFGEDGGDGDEEGRSGTAQGDTLGGSGWGKGKRLNVIMPIGGIVPTETITFSWAGESNESGYKISVYENSEVIFSAITKNNRFTIDVSQLFIVDIEAYSWDVASVAEPNIKSEKITITFGHKDQDKDIIRGMLSDREYSYSDPWLKLLREAYALQKANMLYEANEKYQQGLKEFSDNKTIKNMCVKFLETYNLGAYAETLID